MDDWVYEIDPKPANSDSGWVVGAGYVVTTNGETGVAITFNDGTICFYEGTSRYRLKQLLSSQSAGEYVWDHFYDLPYEKLYSYEELT